MSTWVLLIVLTAGEGAVSFQIDGFESKTQCQAAAQEARALTGGRFFRVFDHACIERKVTR